MPGPHDRGGMPGAGPIDQTEHVLSDWEEMVDNLNAALTAKGLKTTDENRHMLEKMPLDLYESLAYYEKWAYGIENLLVDKGVLTKDEIEQKLAELEEQWGQP